MKPPTFDYSDTTFILACPPSNTSPQNKISISLQLEVQVVIHLHVRPPPHLEVNHPAKADQASHNPTMNGLFRYGHSLNRAKAGSLYTTFIPSLYQLHTPKLVQRQLLKRFTFKICQRYLSVPLSGSPCLLHQP